MKIFTKIHLSITILTLLLIVIVIGYPRLKFTKASQISNKTNLTEITLKQGQKTVFDLEFISEPKLQLLNYTNGKDYGAEINCSQKIANTKWIIKDRFQVKSNNYSIASSHFKQIQIILSDSNDLYYAPSKLKISKSTWSLNSKRYFYCGKIKKIDYSKNRKTIKINRSNFTKPIIFKIFKNKKNQTLEITGVKYGEYLLKITPSSKGEKAKLIRLNILEDLTERTFARAEGVSDTPTPVETLTIDTQASSASESASATYTETESVSPSESSSTLPSPSKSACCICQFQQNACELNSAERYKKGCEDRIKETPLCNISSTKTDVQGIDVKCTRINKVKMEKGIIYNCPEVVCNRPSNPLIPGCDPLKYFYQGHGSAGQAEACIKMIMKVCIVPPKQLSCMFDSCSSVQNIDEVYQLLLKIQKEYPDINWEIKGYPQPLIRDPESSEGNQDISKACRQPIAEFNITAKANWINLADCNTVINTKCFLAQKATQCFSHNTCPIQKKSLECCPRVIYSEKNKNNSVGLWLEKNTCKKSGNKFYLRCSFGKCTSIHSSYLKSSERKNDPLCSRKKIGSACKNK